MPIVTGLPYSVQDNIGMSVDSVFGTGRVPDGSTLAVGKVGNGSAFLKANTTTSASGSIDIAPNNLYADPSNSSITLDDLRMSAAVQQVYELLGRGGSRYKEYINSFFGLDVDNPFDDIPTLLGHVHS